MKPAVPGLGQPTQCSLTLAAGNCPHMLLRDPRVEHGWCDCACRYKPVDYQAIRYYSAPKLKKQLGSLDEVDPEVLKTFEKLGISLNEQARGISLQPPDWVCASCAGSP